MVRNRAALGRWLRGVALLAAMILPNWGRGQLLAKDYTVTITSTPPGAKIVIDGVEKGFTPWAVRVPPGFVRATHSAFSRKLVAPCVLRLSLPGYVTQEVQLTIGPLKWKNLYGITLERYYLFKSTSFHFDLVPAQPGAVDATTGTSGGPSPSAAPPSPAQTTRGESSSAQPDTAVSERAVAGAPNRLAVVRSPLTNADIIRMVKAGIKEKTILLDIGKSPCQFDTSPAALIELKRQRVPGPVIRAMIRAGMPGSPAASQAAQQPQ